MTIEIQKEIVLLLVIMSVFLGIILGVIVHDHGNMTKEITRLKTIQILGKANADVNAVLPDTAK